MNWFQRYLAIIFICFSAKVLAQEVTQGSIPQLGADEGLALFQIDTDFPLERIRLKRSGALFSFPKIEDLEVGKYTRLMRLPAGSYRFSQFSGSWFYWTFDDVRNSEFTVEANKVNYVGTVLTRTAGGRFRNLWIQNEGISARAGLERDFPGLIEKYSWRYTGEFGDPFFDTTDFKGGVKAPEEIVVTPSVEDRDAAEILFRSASAEAKALSPDGRYVIEIASEGENYATRVIDLVSSQSRVFFVGPNPSRIFWVDPQTVVVLARRSGRLESFIYRVKSLTDIVELKLGTGMVVGQVPGSSQIIVLADSALRAIDINDKLDRKSVRNADRLGDTSLSSYSDFWIDGNGRLRMVEFVRDPKQSHSQYLYFDPATNETHRFKLQDQKNARFQLAGLDQQARPLALTNVARKTVDLVRLDPKTGKIVETVVAIADQDLQMADWDVNHRVQSVSYLSNGRTLRRYLVNKSDETLMAGLARALPNRNLSMGQPASNGLRLIYSNGPQDPGTAHVYNAKSKNLQILTYSSPHLEGRPLASSERFLVKAKDGYEIESFITMLPANKGEKRPLIVMPHGGPFEIYDQMQFDPAVQYFAKLGFAVLQMNFRGSGGRGTEQVNLGIKQWGELMISDMEAATDTALARFPVDARRVAAVGSSYGGYSALRLAQVNPKRYRAAVGICGVYDLNLLYSNGGSATSLEGIEWLKKHLADPATETALLQSLSPTHQIDKLQTPVLLVHDRGDKVAAFEHALRLLHVAKASGKPMQVITTNDLEHGLVKAQTAIATYPKIAAFLRTHLSDTSN